jgi:benzoate membrane transport protein
MSDVTVSRSGWFSIISSTATAVVVGFASTILLIMQAAQAVGTTPSQQASWAAALCFGQAVTTIYLSWTYRMPIITAWSTPGAALIATSASGISYENALGAFVVAGLLMALTALLKPLARAIAQIPAPIAAAMLAGVLLKYTLSGSGGGPFHAALCLAADHRVLRIETELPLFAVPVVVVLGVAMAAFAGSFSADCCAIGLHAA